MSSLHVCKTVTSSNSDMLKHFYHKDSNSDKLVFLKKGVLQLLSNIPEMGSRRQNSKTNCSNHNPKMISLPSVCPCVDF